MSAAKVFFFMRWTAADGGGKWVETLGSIIICFGNGGLVGGGGGGGGGGGFVAPWDRDGGG
jgi:hypothetical protein